MASYAVGAVRARIAGSFAGETASGSVVRASYATGAASLAALTPASQPGDAGGFVVQGPGSSSDNYCDRQTTGQSACGGASARSTNQLRTASALPNWGDLDVDGDGTRGEAPWDFGASYQYPVLSYAGLDTAFQFRLQPSEPPTFGTGTVSNKTFRKDFPIDAFQVPAASGGEGVGYTYSASGLPAGLALGAPNCAARTVCGTPTRNTAGGATVTIYAHDGDINRNDSDRAALMFTITVVEPTAAITASTPAALTEATLDNATVTVTLTDTTFASGATASDFMLNTDVSGLTVGALATVPGDAAATLTLAYDDTDFDTARTLGVTVAAAAHSLPGAIATASVSVAPSLDATATPSELTVNEATGSNTGMFDVVLDSDPGATTTVAVASADTGAAIVDKAALTFTTTDWNSAQTVTVTAQADDDANDETVPVTLTASGVGVLARVTVNVTDDDRGTVLIDADPATTALNPGPLLLTEGDTGAYTVRLSAQPSADATVAVASGDTGAVTVDLSSLTFTTQNWNTPQTVTATAVAEASDSVDESVLVAHEATGGGYGGTSSNLRVAVSDAERTGMDYDVDNDGLIEVSTLAQLNAVRWDLDGDGSPASNSADYSGASGASPAPRRAWAARRSPTPPPAPATS